MEDVAKLCDIVYVDIAAVHFSANTDISRLRHSHLLSTATSTHRRFYILLLTRYSERYASLCAEASIVLQHEQATARLDLPPCPLSVQQPHRNITIGCARERTVTSEVHMRCLEACRILKKHVMGSHYPGIAADGLEFRF